MKVIDANLLLYAYNPRAAEHDAASRWLEDMLSGGEFVRFAWLTLRAFLRISTSARVFPQPLSSDEAAATVSSWLAQPAASLIEPGERHWQILLHLIASGQCAGPIVTDAALAAITIEHGATLCTTDRDFARFPGLKTLNPLQPR